MSTLSSSSTYADIVNAYLDGASYEEDASTAKAKAFITACRMLISYPARAKVGGNQAGHELEFDMETLRRQIADAQNWLAANVQTTAGRTTWGDFSNYRE